MLTELEKKIISSIQGDLPVTERPYRELAEKVGISEDKYLELLQGLSDKGIIRRFGATLRHQKSGFNANAMVAWQVEEEQVETVGTKMASFTEVSHCYRRDPAEDWPYNVYTMVHATTEEKCLATARRISEETGVATYSILFSRKELKKTSMKYFSEL